MSACAATPICFTFEGHFNNNRGVICTSLFFRRCHSASARIRHPRSQSYSCGLPRLPGDQFTERLEEKP